MAYRTFNIEVVAWFSSHLFTCGNIAMCPAAHHIQTWAVCFWLHSAFPSSPPVIPHVLLSSSRSALRELHFGLNVSTTNMRLGGSTDSQAWCAITSTLFEKPCHLWGRWLSFLLLVCFTFAPAVSDDHLLLDGIQRAFYTRSISDDNRYDNRLSGLYPFPHIFTPFFKSYWRTTSSSFPFSSLPSLQTKSKDVCKQISDNVSTRHEWET